MAKILFVSQKLTANSLNQIEIIKRSGHEFTVVTSQSEKLIGLSHSDTLYFFSHWNFIELVKFLPSFMIINPDIVHVFIDSKSSVRTAEFFASLARIFRKIFSLQFFLSEETFLKIPKAKKLVYLADVVTGPHRAFLYHLRGMQMKNKYQIKGVIPPVLHLSSKPLPNSAKSFDELDMKDKEYQLLMPLKKKIFDQETLVQIAKHFSVSFVIEKNSWTNGDIKKLNYLLLRNQCRPWQMLPLESFKHFNSSAQKPSSLWMAGLDFELDECIQLFEYCLNRRMKIIMDQTQSRLYPDLWENNPMATVVIKSDIKNFVTHFTLNQIKSNQWADHLDTTSLVDVSVNEFNRLISKATNMQNEKTI